MEEVKKKTDRGERRKKMAATSSEDRLWEPAKDRKKYFLFFRCYKSSIYSLYSLSHRSIFTFLSLFPGSIFMRAAANSIFN